MSLFSAVEMAPRDPILGLNEAFNADPRPHKVNLGVGVYFTEEGRIPLLRAVAEAERALIPPITDDRIRALVTADDLRAAWLAMPLAEQRKVIKVGFIVRVQQTQNRGQNAFEPERVLMEQRAR